MNMLFQCLPPLLSEDIMGQIPDLTFCVSVHPTVLKAIMCILCVAVGIGSHLATGPFHTPTVLSCIPFPLSQAGTAGFRRCLAESEMALGGGEPGRKQVETVPVMAISVPLGQAQLQMKEWGFGGTERRKLTGKQEAEEVELIVKGAGNSLQKLPKEQSHPGGIGVGSISLC